MNWCLVEQPELYQQHGIELAEREDGAIRFFIHTPRGRVQIIADLIRIEHVLVIDGIHVDGEGLTISRIKEVASILGRVEDVEEVVVQGARRNSGKCKGRVPSALRVRVR